MSLNHHHHDHHDHNAGERVGAGDGDSYCDSEASMDDGSCYDQVMMLILILMLMTIMLMLSIAIILISLTSPGAQQPLMALVTASTSEPRTTILI